MDWFTHYEELLKQFSRIEDRAMAEDYLGACRALGRAADKSGEMGIAIAQGALDQGATKKAIAEALGISPSALTGMRKTGSAPPKPKRRHNVGDGLDHLRELLP